MKLQNSLTNYLSIDVEDYFQVSAFENVVGSHTNWQNYSSRVEKNTRRLLDILDTHTTKATFFVLGWIAEKFPRLVREIEKRGHDIACHSYIHRLVYNLTPEQFYEDTRKTKDLLEQATGRKVFGYRAPSFSITNKSLWAFDILEELGFTFDSSIFPIYHDRYGIPSAPRFRYCIEGKKIIEYPISTALILGRKIPVAGGGYFRLLPYRFTKAALTKINVVEKKPFVFYLHPWEIDPKQPHINNISLLSRFRHYNNLKKTACRFEQLLKDFRFAPMDADIGA